MKSSNGFTLIEVLIAMVILGFVVMGVQALVTGRMVGDVTRHDRQALAGQLATSRIQAIQQDPVYTTLEARYTETAAPVPGVAGLTRTTQITPTALRGTINYKTVTVEIAGTGLRKPVARTVVVGAP